MKEIIIGNQIWMASNLNVTHFANGDPIGEITPKKPRSREPGWCAYAFQAEHTHTYGRLYNWLAVSDPRGLAPEGWRIPTVTDWMRLLMTTGSSDDPTIHSQYWLSLDEHQEDLLDMIGEYYGHFAAVFPSHEYNEWCELQMDAADALKTESGWISDEYPFRGPNGHNRSGFGMLPSGIMTIENGKILFQHLTNLASFWTVNEGIYEDEAIAVEFKSSQMFSYDEDREVDIHPVWARREYSDALAIRCIKG